jgi:sigma-B regulation protein RsbU (phosphoserine phosphatase)
MSAALHGALLVRRIAEETTKRERAERERIVRELELAQRIQTSILPKNLLVPGLEIAATMVTATEVGGDYYDVLPLVDGCFIGIGDVAGHGLNTGLVMMMLQSAVAAVVALQPTISPRDALSAANRVLYENVRHRLSQDEHMTLSLLRYTADGTVIYAGAHEEMLVYRKTTGCVERLPITGIWAGIIEDILPLTPEERVNLEPGDVLVLYTDGIIEAANSTRERFGLSRLSDELTAVGLKSATEICAHLLRSVQTFMKTQEDDIAFVVARYVGCG